MRNKIFIYKSGNERWSTDIDKINIENVIKDLGYSNTKNPFTAKIIYVIGWNQINSLLIRLVKKIFKNKKLIATLTNDPNHQREEFIRIKKLVDIWVYANTDQKKFLKKHEIQEKNMFYNPFYVNERIFKNLNLSKKEICNELDINYDLIKGKFLIGSFQRDSLGSNLTQPKWQKNPDLLIDILRELNKKKFLLIIGGPRRHYIINKCKEFNIPFIFIGDKKPIEEGLDDVEKNILGLEKINLLYNFIDLYLITSKSEGGPKAVIEAPLTKTAILSTKIGMAPDLLIKDSLCKSKEEFIIKTEKLRKNISFRNKIVNENYKKISEINNFESFRNRIKIILEST